MRLLKREQWRPSGIKCCSLNSCWWQDKKERWEQTWSEFVVSFSGRAFPLVLLSVFQLYTKEKCQLLPFVTRHPTWLSRAQISSWSTLITSNRQMGRMVTLFSCQFSPSVLFSYKFAPFLNPCFPRRSIRLEIFFDSPLLVVSMLWNQGPRIEKKSNIFDFLGKQ